MSWVGYLGAKGSPLLQVGPHGSAGSVCGPEQLGVRGEWKERVFFCGVMPLFLSLKNGSIVKSLLEPLEVKEISILHAELFLGVDRSSASVMLDRWHFCGLNAEQRRKFFPDH